jgi:formylglycine-generating enzyme required for sulfatase activity
MVPIPAGEFLMGSPDTEAERYETEGPQHRVELQSFFLGQTPVTQAQWQEVASWPQVELKLNPDPARFKGANRPVEQVSWFDAQEFCRRLSRRTGKIYTLPSESQWEYACRAGTTTPYAFGTTLSLRQANVANVASLGTTEVGSFPANLWGLHDMHGNVWEWCLDHWHHGYEGAPADGTAWLSTKDQQDQLTTKPLKGVIDDSEPRLLRGGAWNYGVPGDRRSAFRDRSLPSHAGINVGFRVVCLP